MWQAGKEVNQITSSGGYLDNLLQAMPPPGSPTGNATVCVHTDLALGWEQGAHHGHVQWTMKAC